MATIDITLTYPSGLGAELLEAIRWELNDPAAGASDAKAFVASVAEARLKRLLRDYRSRPVQVDNTDIDAIAAS